tara:strand:- start:16809 stop:17189 length:381 start_codon:yes stop_codon:yes gene_type:complete
MKNLTIKQKLKLRELKDLGIVKIQIHYSGGGDDGCIDSADAYILDENGKEKWDRDIVPVDFLDMFEEVLYNFISKNVEWDWVNNDGGYGSLEINVDTGELTIHHTQRHSEDYEYPIKENPITKALA